MVAHPILDNRQSGVQTPPTAFQKPIFGAVNIKYKLCLFNFKVKQWLNGHGLGLGVNRSRVQIRPNILLKSIVPYANLGATWHKTIRSCHVDCLMYTSVQPKVPRGLPCHTRGTTMPRVKFWLAEHADYTCHVIGQLFPRQTLTAHNFWLWTPFSTKQTPLESWRRDLCDDVNFDPFGDNKFFTFFSS